MQHSGYNKRVIPRSLPALLLCLLSLHSCPSPAWCESESRRQAPAFVDAKVADASDRAYEPAAIWLIDQAKHSVVMSMYLLREGEDARHPVNRLAQDLVEAARRGVRVELYLNTFFIGADPQAVLETPGIRRLRAEGVQIIGPSAQRRLHDKLLIVDERYVLEGSTNWSVSALTKNWESNTLIDSPPLAKQKLRRVRQITVPPEETAPSPKHPALPQTVELPTGWIVRDGVLSRMVSSSRERAFDILLLLVLESARSGPEFFVNLEQLGRDIGIKSWVDTAVRREVIRLLRDLENDSQAGVDTSFAHGKDAWVMLKLPEGPTLAVPSGWLEPAQLAGTPAAVTYLKLFELGLKKQEDLRVTQLTLVELERRTGLDARTLRRALKTMKD